MQQSGYGLLLLFCGLIFSTTACAVNNHAHHPQTEVDADTTHHHNHNDDDLRLNQGEKWPTDEALRQGMRKIRIATDKAMQSAHTSPGHALSQQQADSLAEQVHQQINNIFAECKLPAEADAVLHMLLADMLQAAQQLKTPSEPDKHLVQQQRIESLLNIQNSLGLYPKYFDDKQWYID